MFYIFITILVGIQYANYWHSVVLKKIFIPILANITFFGEAKWAYNNISGDNTEMAESYTLLSLFSYLGTYILLKITMSLTPSVWYRPVNLGGLAHGLLCALPICLCHSSFPASYVSVLSLSSLFICLPPLHPYISRSHVQ